MWDKAKKAKERQDGRDTAKWKAAYNRKQVAAGDGNERCACDKEIAFTMGLLSCTCRSVV